MKGGTLVSDFTVRLGHYGGGDSALLDEEIQGLLVPSLVMRHDLFRIVACS